MQQLLTKQLYYQFSISGLSPFMGETDIQTMANVTIAKYDFEDESFSSVSAECMDFISKLLVKDMRYVVYELSKLSFLILIAHQLT